MKKLLFAPLLLVFGCSPQPKTVYVDSATGEQIADPTVPKIHHVSLDRVTHRCIDGIVYISLEGQHSMSPKIKNGVYGAYGVECERH